MSSEENNEQEHLDRITKAFERLSREMGAFSGDTGLAIQAVRKRQRRTVLIIALMIAGIVLNLALVVGIAINASRISDAQDKADDAAKSLAAVQKRTSDEVLCPLFHIFSATKALPPPPNYSKEEAVQLAKNFAIADRISKELGCTK